jgi:hypothetical protein
VKEIASISRAIGELRAVHDVPPKIRHAAVGCEAQNLKLSPDELLRRILQ